MLLEDYFSEYRKKTIGIDYAYETHYGTKILIYADWAASGRLYKDIEDYLVNNIAVLYGNTHSVDNYIGEFINDSYNNAKEIIKKHVNANEDYVVLTVGYGMTAAIDRLHEIMELKNRRFYRNTADKPVVFLTQMEHHSNYTTWLELDVDVEILEQDKNGKPSIDYLEALLKKYNGRKVKIGSFTACSNVTGIKTDYYEMARLMHKYNGFCFVDFSASAPYVNIDVKANSDEALDAIFFSPHKFLGGPGSSGVLVFNKKLYKRKSPTIPGGGSILWTNPWGGRRYINDINTREDSGTPGILQTIKASLAISLKDKIKVKYIEKREKDILTYLFYQLKDLDYLTIYVIVVK